MSDFKPSGWARRDLRMRRTVQARDGGSLPFAPEAIWLSPGIEVHDRLPLSMEVRA